MDIYSNTIAIINRASRQRQLSALSYYNKLTLSTLAILFSAGFIRGYTICSKKHVRIYFKFSVSGTPVIGAITRVSKPGKRVYARAKFFKSGNFAYNSTAPLSATLISTPKGLKFNKEAEFCNLGGEVLLRITV